MSDARCLRCGKVVPSASSITTNGKSEFEDFYCSICKIIIHRHSYGGINLFYYTGKPPEDHHNERENAGI